MVGVGPRAAAYGPTAHVADLRAVRVETDGDGVVRLYLGD